MQPQPWERRPQPVPAGGGAAGGGAWSAGEDRLAGAARQPEPWERQQSSVAVYDAVLPSSASWAAAPPGVALPTPPGVALPTPPGVAHPSASRASPEPPTDLRGLGATRVQQSRAPPASLWEPEPEPELAASAVGSVLRVDDSVDRVLGAIAAFEEEVALLVRHAQRSSPDAYSAQLQQLHAVADVLRQDPTPETLHSAMQQCWEAAAEIMADVDDQPAPLDRSPAAQLGSSGQQPRLLPTSTAFELRQFLQSPAPDTGLYCRLVRTKGGAYQLCVETMGDGGLREHGMPETAKHLVMSSQKRKRTESKKGNYPINMEGFGDAGPLGKMRTLTRGDAYSVYDAGKNSSKLSKQQKRLAAEAGDAAPDRAELATVRTSRKATEGPSWEALVSTGEEEHRPRKKGEAERAARGVRPDGRKFKPPPAHLSVLHKHWPAQSGEVAGGMVYMSTPARPKHGAWGKGKLPALRGRNPAPDVVLSTRNVLLRSGEDGPALFQLAQITKDKKMGTREFVLDFWAPITPLAAFGMALAIFEQTSITR